MSILVKHQVFNLQRIFFLLLILLFSLFVACSDENNKPTIRVSLLPDTSKEQLISRYVPLLDYITEKTGTHFELVLVDSYKDLYNKFKNKEVDLAYFGGYTYVKARLTSQAEPLIFRDTDERFYSVILVKKNNPAKTLHDLKNTDFSFGSKLSTSGHLMPRYFFSKQKIEPESFFKNIIYSGAHDKTAQLVNSNKVTAGVANAEIVKRMFNDGRLNKKSVRILWTSPPYPDYVWAIQPYIPNSTKNDIREAFLSLNQENKKHAELLAKVGAKHFLPATHENFAILEDTIKKLDLVN